jgi:hypothetical protein
MTTRAFTEARMSAARRRSSAVAIRHDSPGPSTHSNAFFEANHGDD